MCIMLYAHGTTYVFIFIYKFSAYVHIYIDRAGKVAINFDVYTVCTVFSMKICFIKIILYTFINFNFIYLL